MSWEQTEKVLLVEARRTGELRRTLQDKTKQNSIFLNGLGPEEDTATRRPSAFSLDASSSLQRRLFNQHPPPLEAMHKDLYAIYVYSSGCSLGLLFVWV